jgi:hypothetical protein
VKRDLGEEVGKSEVGSRNAERGPGRPIDECITLAREHGSGATLDEDFAKDLEEIIASRKPIQ